MAKLSIVAGATSQTVNVFIADSSSTTGAGLTGLAYNTSSLVAYYALPKAAAVQITLATLAAVSSAYSSGGFKEIDATNMPGWYRLDVPDAALASGRFVAIHLKGAANMAPLPLEIELTAWNNQDAVRGGLTAMPNANAGANGGLPLSVDTSGRVDVLKINGTSQTGRDIGASVLLSAGTGTGQLDFTSGVVKANLAQILGTALTETAGLLAGGFKKFFNVASPTLTCLDINQTGDSYARLGAPAGASVSADIAAMPGAAWDVTLASHLTSGSTGAALNAAGSAGDPWATALPGAYGTGTAGKIIGANLDAAISSRTKPADTQAAVTTVTNLTNAPTSGDFSSTMKTSLNAATPAVTVSDKTGFSLSSAGIQAIWDALTSALATVGSIGRLLVTNLDSAVSTRLATSGYTAPDNSDIAAIKAKTDNLPALPAAVGSAMTLTSAYDASKTASQVADIPTANQNADALLDRSSAVETGYTPRMSLRIILSALAGKISGAATTSVAIRNATDSKNRITATVDSDGNRTAVTLDGN